MTNQTPPLSRMFTELAVTRRDHPALVGATRTVTYGELEQRGFGDAGWAGGEEAVFHQHGRLLQGAIGKNERLVDCGTANR